jgi:hypothetical protein
MLFFAEVVKPAVIDRLKAEGRWFPYVRTLTGDEKPGPRSGEMRRRQRRKKRRPGDEEEGEW